MRFACGMMMGGILAATLLAAASMAADNQGGGLPIAPGPFKPAAESLQQYQCPEWFRDAKFGIWAHWGPQAVPRSGDWYARRMYLEDDKDYKHHLATYGHPSKPFVRIQLLGSNEKLDWSQQPDALVIQCPAKMPCDHAVVLKLTFGP